MVRGGAAASAVLVFIFSWTEFLLSLFLTTEIRTVPVKIQTFVTSTGNEWGFIAALGTAAAIPSSSYRACPTPSGPRPDSWIPERVSLRTGF